MSRTSFSLIEKGQLPIVKKTNPELEVYSREFPEKYKSLVEFCDAIKDCNLNQYYCCSK